MRRNIKSFVDGLKVGRDHVIWLRRAQRFFNTPELALSIWVKQLDIDVKAAGNRLHIRYDTDCDNLPETGVQNRKGGPISHVEDPSPRLTLGKLADIIAQARQGPGLRSFRFEEFSIVPEWSYSAAQKLWEQVGHHAPSLRYLGLRLERMDFPVEVSETAFAYLEEFSLSFVDADVVLPLVEPFLDGAKRLRSLVLRLSGCGKVAQHKNILHKKEFPPALEYFCLREYFAPETLYYRFVSCHPEAHIIVTKSGGKRGRLQRVPGVFRQRITEDGVWHQPLSIIDTDTILDHLGGPSSLSFD
ncbi:hypothetical protein OC846_003989 [Tilletia horrida]|uniref:Uncharacterized protein n=1 Tax=Tilletia horrida TaxID=155126 RepID=A0AAN6GPI1_9BASI|nr:hypothetical protein OC846_003989 [Tilletia horrida]